MYGSQLVLVDRWFSSSKICANCGQKKDLPLSVRTYDCPACGVSIDRDLNASLNILNWEPSEEGAITVYLGMADHPIAQEVNSFIVAKDGFS